MSNWCNLPLEILRIIFSYLKNGLINGYQTGLDQCALTCTQWKNTAHSIYFSEIELDFTIQLDNIESLVSRYPLFGKWVKSLTIVFEFESDNDLIRIDTLFPCVEEFDHYFSSDNDSYWFLFHKLLVKDGKFRYLKKFELSVVNKYQRGLYIECLMFIKDRVTFMDLSDRIEYDTYSFYKDICKHFVDNLHQFNNLSAIKIYDPNDDLSCRMIDLLETFTQSNSISDITYTLETVDSSKFYSSIDLNVSTVQPATNIKKLFLYITLINDDTLPIASDNSLRYLMKKFPNLGSLHIDYIRTTSCLQCLHPEIFDHTIQSAAVMNEFLIYLSKIPNCFVRLMINSNDNIAHVIQDLYTSAAANKRSNISSSRNLKIVHRRSWQVEPEDLQRKVFMDFETINAKTQTIRVSFNDNDITRFLQQRLDLIEQTGHFFDHLHIEFGRFPNELMSLISHITKYCTRLNELSISSWEGGEQHDWESFMIRKVLTKNRNVKKLNLLGRLPFLEQTQYIIHQLEGLEALCIHLSHTSRNARTIEDESSSLINFLPNGSFKSLEIVLDESSTYRRDLESFFIRLVTELEESDRYFSLRRVFYSTSYEVIENLTESEFEDSISDPTSLHWQIYCKSVESFTIKYIASPITKKLQRITISP